MKKFIVLAAIIALATSAEAANFRTKTLFSNLSTTGNSAVIRSTTQKSTLVVRGYDNAREEAALDGTVVLQCGPTISGPWLTAKDQAANAISATAIGTWNLDSACAFFRATWTRTTGNISAWLIQAD